MSDTPALPPADSMAELLRQRLCGARAACFGSVEWVAQTGSTNADLLGRARARRGANTSGITEATQKRGGIVAKPWLLGAHLQQTGRGRAGRAWQNRPGAALMFSCAFDTTLPVATLPTLSPLAGLAACEALRAVAAPGGRQLCVKWPNDLQWEAAKLAGILVETARNHGAQTHTVVIGMGMNLLDGAALARDLQRPVADWRDVGASAALDEVVAGVALAWQAALVQAEREGFASCIDRYARLDALAGRDIRILDGGRVLHRGVACGTDAQGRLLVRTADGQIPVCVGEVSVRPA